MRRALAIVVVALAACAPQLGQVTIAQVDWAAKTWPGTTRLDLEQGRATYIDKCSGCHTLHLPEEYPADHWRDVVVEMAPRAKLDGAEQDRVIRYLMAAAEPAGPAPAATAASR